MRYLKIAIIPIAIVIVLIMLLPKGCSTPGIPDNSNLPILLENQKLKEVERLTYELGIERNKTDSLKALKPKVVYRYKTVYDSIYIESDSVCRLALLITHNECLKLDSVNASIISGQENQLTKYSEMVGNYKDIIVLKDYKNSIDSLNMIGLNDEIKHQKKRVVKAKVGGGLIAILCGAAGFRVGKVMP